MPVRKRSDAEPAGECPVCMETFEASGPRAEIRPFLCQSGVAHAICSACDRTMYTRQDDRCPTCRANRSGSSVQRNGPRPMSLPPPMDGGFVMPEHPGSQGIDPRFFSGTDFLSWLPRRIGVGGDAVDRRGYSYGGGLTQVGGSYGRRAFYPDESELSLPGILSLHNTASATRRSRGLGSRTSNNVNMLRSPISGLSMFHAPVDLTGDDPEPEDPHDPDGVGTAYDAALAAMLSDEGIGVALEGLRNLPGLSASEFARRVRYRGNNPLPVVRV